MKKSYTMGKQQERLLTPFEQAFAGCVSGFACLFAGHPIDTVKVLAQSENKTPRSIVTHLLKNEGLMSLYRGIGPQMVRPVLFSSVLFGSYGTAKQALLMQNFIDPDPECEHCVSVRAGASAGFVTSPLVALVACPLELIKCKQQVNRNLSFKEVTKEIMRLHGPTGIYRGFLATCGRSSFNFVYFAVYEYFQATGKTMMAGAASGLAFWTLCYPADVVKTLRQTTTLSYKEIFRIITERGYTGFYRGFSTTIIRAVPVNIAAVCAYSSTLYAFSNFNPLNVKSRKKKK